MLCLIRLRILQNGFPESALSWEFCYIYFRWSIYSVTVTELYLRLYWYVFHLITVSILLCLCMLHNITVGYNSSCYFVSYLSWAYVITPLHICYICVCINMFVNVIYMVTVICLCTSYNPLLGCATSWESCHAYFL